MSGLSAFFSNLFHNIKCRRNIVNGLTGNGNLIVQSFGKGDINYTYNGMISCIQPIDGFINTWKDKADYVTFPNFDKLKEQMLADDGRTIRFLGLSGLGKSRLVYEIFSKIDNKCNYYCANASDSRVVNDLSFLLTHKREKGYVVLDNCDTQSFLALLNTVQASRTQFKVITIYNDPNESSKSYNVNVIRIRRDDMKDAVSSYIDKSLKQLACDDTNVFEQIRHMSDGFPSIAIHAIEEYKKQGSPKLIKDEILWQKMCGDTIVEVNYKTALESLSLFDPLGYKEEVKNDYDFVRYDEDITPLYGMENAQKDNIFFTLISNLTERELIEYTSSWIVVRPLPLAVWLVGEWFKGCEDERFERVVQKLDGIENHYQSERMKRAFCKRLEYMQDNQIAIDMYNRLMDINGPFRNEKVVCSDFGSRLFLAISTVNPVAVTSCLYSIISIKTTEWLKNNIIKDTRRNLVWCLEHLCFPKESFEQAAWILAKLSLAENEDWGNNATGNFLQLFHIMLPGTCADLQQRLNLIHSLYNFGEETIPLLIRALDRAYDYGNFTRDGGGEKFGFKTLYDYNPNGTEIINYWNRCREVIQSILKRYPEYINDIKTLIFHHTYTLGPQSGCWDILFGLLSDIYDADSSSWQEMSKELYTLKINNYSKTDKENRELDLWIDKLSSHSYVETLSNASYRFYNEDRYKGFDERIDKVEQYWKPYVGKFISEKLYNDIDTIRQLMDYEEVDYTFCRTLSIDLKENQTNELVCNIEKVIAEKDNDYVSVFVNIVLGTTQFEGIFNSFCDTLLKTSHFALYYNILSPKETKDLSLLDKVLSVIRRYKLSGEKYLPIYLSRAPIYDGTQMYNTCRKISETIPEAEDILLNYIYGKQYSKIIFAMPMYDMTKKIVLDYLPHESKLIRPRQVNSLANNILRKKIDFDFAKAYNLKIIKSTGDYETYKKSESLYDHVYFELLPKYQKAILEDVLDALSNENPIFWLSFQMELGSGMGMGSGPLFQCNIDIIKQRCLKERKGYLPARLAQMCPVFKYSKEKNGYEDKFSDFFYWIVDNIESFTKQKEILNSFHANIGTFSWSGSVLPLMTRKQNAFKALKNATSNTKVLKWIDDSLSGLEKEINREEKSEAYESLA